MVDVLGTRLGRYDIRERLGKGGMASVYKAWDTNLDRWVAIKVLHDYLAEETDFKNRFEREAKVVASLNHPNIVQVYDFDVTERNGTPIYYMVMAYIPGRSLKSLMDEYHHRGERVPVAEIDNVMQGVCNALTYAHAQGMVHRDVTPGNILFNEQGQAVLADFGIARMITGARLTQTGMTSGTPVYMPPEQGIGNRGDHRSDIYSLGVILFEMLVGEAPYSGDSAVAIILKHINEPVPSPLDRNKDLPVAMESLIFRALAKDAEDRFQSAQQMLNAYQQVRSGIRKTLVKDDERTVLLPTAQPTRRGLPWALLAGGLAIVLFIIASAFFFRANGTFSGATGIAATTANSPTAAAMAANSLPTLPKGFAPSMADGPLIFTDTFGPDRKELLWPIMTDNPLIYRNVENNSYHIRLTALNTALPTIFDEDRHYGAQFEYEADLTISETSQRDSAAGIIFRYRDDDNYYVYALNGTGQISIWARNKGTWTELRKLPVSWTPAAGAKPAGQSNHLKLIDNGKQLLGFVNDQLAINVESEPMALSGAIGIYVATPSSSKVTEPMVDVKVTTFSTAYYVPPTESAVTPGPKGTDAAQ